MRWPALASPRAHRRCGGSGSPTGTGPGSGGRAQADRQHLTPAEDDPGVEGRLVGEGQVGESSYQVGDGDLALHAGQRGAQAVVHPAPERHMPVGVGTAHVEVGGGVAPEPGLQFGF